MPPDDVSRRNASSKHIVRRYSSKPNSVRSRVENGVVRLALVLVFLSLPLFGCETGETTSSGDDAMSRSEVGKETVSMLIQSQQALKRRALQKALALADSVVRRAPRLADAHFQRARVLSELKRFNDAENAYRKVLSLDPNYRGAWFNLGNNAYRRQNYKEALRYFQKEQDRHPSASALVEIGKAYKAIGKIDSARQAHQRALQRDSSQAAAHARLGQLYEEEGQLETALQHSRRALEVEPDNVNYQYVVGLQLFQLGRYDEAIDHFKTVIEERPWHHGAHYNLGQALVRTDRSEEGKRYLSRADSLEEQQREIERLESVAQDSPGDPGRWKKLGDAYRQAGRLTEAWEAYSIALYLSPRNPTLRNNVAQLAANRGDYETAIAHYRTLLNQHPSFIEGWFNLGVVYARNGEPQKARKMWKRVLQKVPDHPQAKEYLSRLPEESR